MSEPTGGDKQQPVPDPDKGQEGFQDETPDPVYNDPTAPVWADPTTPIPASPAPPGAPQPQGDQATANPQATPPPAPPVSNPYAQQPPAQPYAQQPPAEPYGQPQPPQYPPYGQQPYATAAKAPTNTSGIVLTILSGVSVLSCNILAIGSLVLGIMSLSKNATDPEASRRLTKIGWIVLASVWAIGIIVLIVAFIQLVSSSNNFDSDFSY
jgi:F0F1-type ATP synthase membrane subunit c/vacuolar-type H+-ATPase subunit K